MRLLICAVKQHLKSLKWPEQIDVAKKCVYKSAFFHAFLAYERVILMHVIKRFLWSYKNKHTQTTVLQCHVLVIGFSPEQIVMPTGVLLF